MAVAALSRWLGEQRGVLFCVTLVEACWLAALALPVARGDASHRGPEFSQPPDQDHRALPARRRRRPDGAAPDGAAVEGARPDDRDREQGRRRRHHRRRGDVACAGRRLYAVADRRRHAHRGTSSAQDALRSDGAVAHHAAGAHAVHRGGAQRPAGQDAARIHGSREEDRDPLGLRRHRHQPASGGRALHPDVGPEDGARALSRHRAGAERSRRRHRRRLFRRSRHAWA